MELRREHWWDRSSSADGSLFRELPDGVAERAHTDHLGRYLELQRRRRADPGVALPDDIYLVDATDATVREIIGFKLTGHPMAVLGAVGFPHHQQSPVPYGRPSLAAFFSKPPTLTPREGAAPPPGSITVFIPRLGESIPELVKRLRSNPDASGVQIDVDLIDYAFDLRFRNPSVIPRHGAQPDTPQRRLLRTVHGHVLSGISVGLYKSLRKGLGFVTLTDAMQHRLDGSVHLPTLALNRKMLAVETSLEEGAADGANSLFLHPSSANQVHFLGAAYDRARTAASADRRDAARAPQGAPKTDRPATRSDGARPGESGQSPARPAGAPSARPGAPQPPAATRPQSPTRGPGAPGSPGSPGSPAVPIRPDRPGGANRPNGAPGPRPKSPGSPQSPPRSWPAE